MITGDSFNLEEMFIKDSKVELGKLMTFDPVWAYSQRASKVSLIVQYS